MTQAITAPRRKCKAFLTIKGHPVGCIRQSGHRPGKRHRTIVSGRVVDWHDEEQADVERRES